MNSDPTDWASDILLNNLSSNNEDNSDEENNNQVDVSNENTPVIPYIIWKRTIETILVRIIHG